MSDDVNDSMVNDFVESEILINDDGTELSSNPFDGSTVQQNKQPESQNQNNNANNATKQPIANNQNQQSAQPAPDPFDSQFFVQEKNGNKTFDASKALDFLQNRSGFQTSQSLNKIFQPQVAPAQQPIVPQQPDDNRPQWEKDMEEEQKLRESFLTPKMSWPNHFQKALELGYQGDAAIAYANDQVKQDAEKDFMKASYERRYKAQEEAKQKEEAAKLEQQIVPKSRINIAKASAELGGADKLNALIFGVQGPDGKLSNGYGLDVVNMLFDMAHEGKQLPKDAEGLAKTYESWWTRFTSNENNLRFVLGVAQANLQKALFPNIVDHINSVKNQNGVRTTQASQSQMNGINKGQAQSEPDAFDKYFMAPDTI